MELKLYHYVHCPYCIRVRMTAGLLGLPYESKVIPYNDEETPLSLTGTKMLPIMSFDGKAMNESLDIMAKLDSGNTLKVKEFIASPEYSQLSELLDKLAKNVHNLAMPYWIYTPEFDDASRDYFQKKKEQKRGPFKDLIKNRMRFEQELMKDLYVLNSDLRPFYKSSEFSVADILLASHLWGLYVVPEFQFPDQLHHYLQSVKSRCHFNYHEDFWR